MYIEKAHPALQEFFRNDWDGLTRYETDSNFREFCDLVASASPEAINRAIEIIKQAERGQ